MCNCTKPCKPTPCNKCIPCQEPCAPKCNEECLGCETEITDECVRLSEEVECLELPKGTPYSDVIQKVAEEICALKDSEGDGNCPCPVATYTITGVCKGLVNSTPIIYVQLTPNFTWNFPVTLFTSANINNSDAAVIFRGDYLSGTYYNTVQNVTSGIPIPTGEVPFCVIYAGDVAVTDSDELIFQVTDNRGNYSNKFTILYRNINNCS